VLWPVADEQIAEIANTSQAIIVPEMNMGQYIHPVREAACGKTKIYSLPKVGGVPISSREILKKIEEVERNG
jgi:2-oxoglutarate ferredoxin oxidoreductase subunit alpha